ncbi:hypothetical protein A2191_02015 [Candidatus Woesebacteria bacterium RIFOXYA1_FULL_38_9]|nr:MAG: hypothetical protein A2191_02015 [Candidatus Woesebacteria bacterium RIFOXYA1_FULL_38_9]
MDTEKQASWKTALFTVWMAVFLFAIYCSAKTVSGLFHLDLAMGFLIFAVYLIIFVALVSVLAGRIDRPRGKTNQINAVVSYIPLILLVLATSAFMIYATLKVAKINDWPLLKIALGALGGGVTIILAKISSFRRARKEKQMLAKVTPKQSRANQA